MMRLLCCGLFVAVLLGSHLSSALSLSKADEEKARKSCYAELKLDAAAIKRIEADQYHTIDPKKAPHNELCYGLCYYKAIGLVSADGIPNIPLVKEYIIAMYKGDEKHGLAVEKKCSSPTGATKCEKAFAHVVCVRERPK